MAALLLLVALIAPGIAQNSYCPTPSPSNPCDFDDPNAFTTSYINVVADTAKTVGLDNVCHTYFPVHDKYCSYVAYLTCVYSNGTVETLSFLVSSNATNVLNFYSPTCSFQEIGLTANNQVEIIQRRIISGDCSGIIYPVLVSYPCIEYGSADDLGQIKQVLSSNGVGCTDIKVLPRNLPPQCVNTQTSTSVGSTFNCPGPCYGSPSSYDDTFSVPSYPNYVYPPSYPPNTYYPSPCGCGSSK